MVREKRERKASSLLLEGSKVKLRPDSDHSPLDWLDIKISLLPGDVVGSHDTDLLSSGHNPREDTPKGIETAFICRGNHLGDVHHKWCLCKH